MRYKALWKDTFREIPKSITRFLAILIIIFLGVGFFVGISATSPNMIRTADDYFRTNNLMDFNVQSTYGLTAEDLADLDNMEDISAEGHYAYDFLVEEYTETIRLYSYDAENGEDINQYHIESGRLPMASGEIAIDAIDSFLSGIEIGNTITLETGEANGAPEDNLAHQEFEVVGFVNTPMYITSTARGNTTVGNGTLNGFGVILEEDYNTDVYTQAHLSVKDADKYLAFSDAYEDYIDSYEENLSNQLTHIEDRRGTNIQKEAQAEIDEGWTEIKEGEQALADAETELQAARQELNEGWQEYEEGSAELENQMSQAEAEINRNEAALNQTIAELETQRQELVNQRTALQTQLEGLDTAQNELNAGRTQLEQGLSQLNAGIAEIEANKPTIEAGLGELTQQEAQLENSKIQLAELKQTLENLDQQIASLEGQLDNTPSENQTALQTELDTLRAYRTQIENELNAQNINSDQIDEGLAQIENSRQELNAMLEQEQALREQKNQLEAQRVELNAQEQQLVAGREQLETGITQINNGINQIDEGLTEARAGHTEIENGRATLDAERSDAEAELQAAEQQLNEAEADYQDGLTTFEEERDTALEELQNGRNELEEAEANLNNLPTVEYLSTRREENSDLIEYKENTDRLSIIAAVFPVFFFLIAIFISFTTMTRMVDEEREYIGIMKALGYANRQIVVKFLTYSILATALGTLLGLVGGYTFIPWLIFDAYSSMYHLPPIHLQQYTLYTVIALLAAFASTVGASLIAVRNSLQSNAATLLQPKAPRTGAHIWLENIPFIWKRLSFDYKITLRNVFRYKSRMFMTIFGIAGSTGLILTGFGISDSISTIPDTQFSELNHYQAFVALNTTAAEDEIAQYTEKIQNHEQIEDELYTFQENVTIDGEDVNTQDATLFIPEDPSRIDDFVTLRHYETGEPYGFDNSGAYITQKLAQLFDLEVGDQMSLEYAEEDLTVDVAGIVENYVGHTIFMTPDYFTSIANNEEIEPNLQLIKYDTSEVDQESLGRSLMNEDEVAGITYVTDVYDSFSGTLNSLDLITQILVVSAAALAFIVLYNLTNINVSERERELSTIKVLGFHDKEVTMYIYRENIILTVIGIFFGLLFGTVLVRFIMGTMEVDQLVFGREIALSSYLYSIGLTILFSIIVMVVIHYQLKRINMVEALKSND